MSLPANTSPEGTWIKFPTEFGKEDAERALSNFVKLVSYSELKTWVDKQEMHVAKNPSLRNHLNLSHKR